MRSVAKDLGQGVNESGSYCEVEKKRQLDALKRFARSSALDSLVSSKTVKKISEPEFFHADRSNIVSEKYGLDEVRLHNLKSLKLLIGARKSSSSAAADSSQEAKPNDSFEAFGGMDSLSESALGIIRKVASRAKEIPEQAALYFQMLALKSHPWFECLHFPAGEKPLDEPESGWVCQQCEEVNEDDQDMCNLCMEPRPSTENAISTLLEHGVKERKELQLVLMVAQSLANERHNPSDAAELNKENIYRTLKSLENSAPATPEDMCRKLENYVYCQRVCRAFRPTRLVSIGGRVNPGVSPLTVSSTEGIFTVPAVLTVPGKSVSLQESSNMAYYEVQVRPGVLSVKIGWAAPSVLYGEGDNTWDTSESQELAIDDLCTEECKACTYHFFNTVHSSKGKGLAKTNVPQADSFDETSTMMSSMLLNRQIDSLQNGFRGRRKVVSVTMKLGAGPSGTLKNKWAVVVCRRTSMSSRSFELVARTEICIDDTLLMQGQTVRLQTPLVVDHGDYLGLCNPYGTLGLCTHSKSSLSKEVMLYSSSTWETEGDALNMSAFSSSSRQTGKTYAGFSFELAPMDLDRESAVFGKCIEGKLKDGKGLWAYDIGKEFSTHVAGGENTDNEKPKAENIDHNVGPSWHDGTSRTANSVGCYCRRLDSGEWSIGYILNGQDIGHRFNTVAVNAEGLVPLIIICNSVATDGPVEHTEATNNVVPSSPPVHTPPQQILGLTPPLISTSPTFVTPPTNGSTEIVSNTMESETLRSPTTSAMTTPPKLSTPTAPVKTSVPPSRNTFVTLCLEERMKGKLQWTSKEVGTKAIPAVSDFVSFPKSSFLLAPSLTGASIPHKGGVNDMTVEIILRPTLEYVSGLKSTEESDNFSADIFLYRKHEGLGLTMAFLKDGRMFCYLQSSGEYVVTKSYRIRSPTWHHISMCCQSGCIKVFVDGVSVRITAQKKWNGSGRWNPPIENTEGMALAVGSIFSSQSSGKTGWSGDVAGVRVWNCKRTDLQIAELTGRSKVLTNKLKGSLEPCLTGIEKGLHAFFPFVEGTGGKIRNISIYPKLLGDFKMVGGCFWATETCTDALAWKEAKNEFAFSTKNRNQEDVDHIVAHRLMSKKGSVYSSADCLRDVLSSLSYHANEYYSANIARKKGKSLGGLYSASAPTTIVQPSTLTFRLLCVLITELKKDERGLLSLLKICLANIYKLKWSDSNLNTLAVSDGSLREVLETLLEHPSTEVKRFTSQVLAAGVVFFYSDGDTLFMLLDGLLTDAKSGTISESRLYFLVHLCTSIAEHPDMVAILLHDRLEQENDSLELASLKAGVLLKNLRSVVLSEWFLTLQGHDFTPLHWEQLVRLLRALQDKLVLTNSKSAEGNNGKTGAAQESPIVEIFPEHYTSEFISQMTAVGTGYQGYGASLNKQMCGPNLKISPDGCSVSPRRKGWGTVCAQSEGFSYKTGSYKFVIRIDAINREGFVFVGLLFEGGSVAKYVGADHEGLGFGYLLCRGSMWHRNANRPGPKVALSPGATLEFTVDTDKRFGLVSLRDVTNDKDYGVLMSGIFRKKEDLVCFPAFCPYDVGDKISLLSCDAGKNIFFHIDSTFAGEKIKPSLLDKHTNALVSHGTEMLESALRLMNNPSTFHAQCATSVLNHLSRPLFAGVLSLSTFGELSDSLLEKCIELVGKLLDNIGKFSVHDTHFKLCFDIFVCLVSMMSRYAGQLMNFKPNILPAVHLNTILKEPIFVNGFTTTPAWVGWVSELKNGTPEGFAFEKWALEEVVKYSPSFVVSRGGDSHEQLVRVLVACVLHHAKWSWNGQTLAHIQGNVRQEDGSRLLLKAAWTMALDVKAWVLRSVGTTQNEKVVSAIDTGSFLLELLPAGGPNLSTNGITKCIKTLACSNFEPDELRSFLVESASLLQIRGKGMRLMNKVMTAIPETNLSDSESLANTKIIAHACALKQVPPSPWHFENGLYCMTEEELGNQRKIFCSMTQSLTRSLRNVWGFNEQDFPWLFKKIEHVLPLLIKGCAFTLKKQEVEQFLSTGFIAALSASLTGGNCSVVANSYSLLCFHILQLVSLSDEKNHLEMVSEILYDQLNFVTTLSEHHSKLKTDIVSVILACVKCTECATLFSNTRWLTLLVGVLFTAKDETVQAPMVELTAEILSQVDSDSLNLGTHGIDSKNSGRSLLHLIMTKCLQSFPASSQCLSDSLKRIAQSGNKWKSIVIENICKLVKCGLSDDASSDEVLLGTGAFSILCSRGENYATWGYASAEATELVFLVFDKYAEARGDNLEPPPFFGDNAAVVNLLNAVYCAICSGKASETMAGRVTGKVCATLLDLALCMDSLAPVSVIEGKLKSMIENEKKATKTPAPASSNTSDGAKTPASSMDGVIELSAETEKVVDGMFEEVDSYQYESLFRYMEAPPLNANSESFRPHNYKYITSIEVIHKHLYCRYARRLILVLINMGCFQIQFASRILKVLFLALSEKQGLQEDIESFRGSFDHPRENFRKFITKHMPTLQRPMLLLLRGQLVKLTKPRDAVHNGVTCDVSGMSPIVGNRYKKRGANYDLCEAEYQKLDAKNKSLYVLIERPDSKDSRRWSTRSNANVKMMTHAHDTSELLKWLTFLVVEGQDGRDRLGTYESICKAWCIGLKSCSMIVKEQSFTILNDILTRLEGSDILPQCVSHVPVAALVKLAAKRLDKEMESYPVISTFCQRLLEFVANLYRLGFVKDPLSRGLKGPLDRIATHESWETYHGVLKASWRQAITINLLWEEKRVRVQIELCWHHNKTEQSRQSEGEGELEAGTPRNATVKMSNGPLEGATMCLDGSNEQCIKCTFTSLVHVLIRCDRSQMSPILGVRYHKIGEDYDLCEAEFAKLPEEEQKLYEKLDSLSPPAHIEAYPESTVPFIFSPIKSDSSHIKLSEDLHSAEAISNEHSIVYANRGFSSGVHYWSVKLDVMEWGKTYIGVAEKDCSLHGWPTNGGYGLVTYRATHGRGRELFYGTMFQSGDTVGVLLDMDRGQISFIKEGEDPFTGKKVFLNMGVAYHNIRTNNGTKENVKLYPCIGFGKEGSKATLKNCKFLSIGTPCARDRVFQFCRAATTIRAWNSDWAKAGATPLMEGACDTWKRFKSGTLKKTKAKDVNDVLKAVKRAFDDGATKVVFDTGDDKRVKETDAKSVMDVSEFADLARKFSIEDAIDMVAKVNDICDRKNISPYQLSNASFLEDNTRAREVLLALFFHFNACVGGILPFIDFSAHRDNRSLNFESNLGEMVAKARGWFFRKEKMVFWKEMLVATTIFTRPPEDEWEKPGEIPEIKINRVGAATPRLKAIADQAARRSASVFGQLEAASGKWSSTQWRRSYQHINDKGQSRCFFVKCLGENVDDNGGPYRAIFAAAACDEPQQVLDILDDDGHFNFRSDADTVTFFGKLTGLAMRHGIQLPLHFSPFSWSWWTSQTDDLSAGVNDYHGKQLVQMLKAMEREDAEILGIETIGEDNYRATEKRMRREAQASQTTASASNATPTIEEKGAQEVVQCFMLNNKQTFLNAFESGMGHVIPTPLLRMFTPKEFETILCGSKDVDLDLLKDLTVYDEGLTAETPHIAFFWNALESMSNDQQGQFINFVYAKRRLPSIAAGFMMPFHIVKPTLAMQSNPDKFLPHAKTCFFELSIPPYSSFDVCLERLLYAIQNCTTMEDFANGGAYDVFDS